MKKLSILEKLVDRNAYPIVFIGSGMSMRYTENFPNWNGLILELWKKAFQDNNEENYYKFMLQMRDEIEKKYDNESGLNLTWQVLEGILKHTRIKRNNELWCDIDRFLLNLSNSKFNIKFENLLI